MATRKKGDTRAKQWMRMAAWVAGALLVCWFAVEGGEYGTRSLFTQHARRERLAAEVAQLRHEIDSLQKEKDAVLHDPATLERIAREQYGMVKGDKELLFWVGGGRTHGDSVAVAGDTSGTSH